MAWHKIWLHSFLVTKSVPKWEKHGHFNAFSASQLHYSLYISNLHDEYQDRGPSINDRDPLVWLYKIPRTAWRPATSAWPSFKPWWTTYFAYWTPPTPLASRWWWWYVKIKCLFVKKIINFYAKSKSSDGGPCQDVSSTFWLCDWTETNENKALKLIFLQNGGGRYPIYCVCICLFVTKMITSFVCLWCF